MSDRVIGLGGAVATIIGFVIGISVFVLPGTLAASTGPAVVVTYVIASLFGVFSCVVAAQLGVCYPTSGGSFVAVDDLVGSVWAFLLVWCLVGAGSVGIALLAYGLADYLGGVVTLDRRLVALSAVLVFAVTNARGARASIGIQSILVALFLVALVVFVAAGISRIEMRNLQPFFATGWSPVWLAVIPAYFSYTGFMVIVELAGEVRDPGRTIPKALFISFFLVLMTYTLVALTVVGVVPWTELAGDAAPVATAAAQVLPPSLVSIVTLTAVAAAASSINGVLLGYSRDLHVLVRRGMLPRATLFHARWMDAGSAGVVPIAMAASLAIVVGSGIEALAVQAVVGMLLVQGLLGVALLRLPGKRMDLYLDAGFRLPRPLLSFFASGLVGTSVLGITAVVASSLEQVGVAAAYCVTGVMLYLRQGRRTVAKERAKKRAKEDSHA